MAFFSPFSGKQRRESTPEEFSQELERLGNSSVVAARNPVTWFFWIVTWVAVQAIFPRARFSFGDVEGSVFGDKRRFLGRPVSFEVSLYLRFLAPGNRFAYFACPPAKELLLLWKISRALNSILAEAEAAFLAYHDQSREELLKKVWVAQISCNEEHPDKWSLEVMREGDEWGIVYYIDFRGLKLENIWGAS